MPSRALQSQLQVISANVCFFCPAGRMSPLPLLQDSLRLRFWTDICIQLYLGQMPVIFEQ